VAQGFQPQHELILAFEAGKSLQYLLPALEQTGQAHFKYSMMDVTLFPALLSMARSQLEQYRMSFQSSLAHF